MTLDVVEVPTNRPMIRIDHNDLVYKSAEGKYRADHRADHRLP